MLIGLTGKARSGKDSVATYLHEKYAFHWMTFADSLKRILGDLLELSDDQLYGTLKEVEDPRFKKSPRWLLQYIGTDVFRNIYPSCWANKTIREYKAYLRRRGEANKRGGIDLPIHVVISDVRFYNEIEVIKHNGGNIWKIVREDNRGASSGIENHPSECELDNAPDEIFQCILTAGTGQLDKLYKQADEAIAKLQ